MVIILFDFDGVLADTLEDMLNFAREACAQLGVPSNPTPADLDALETMSFAEYGRQLKIPMQNLDEFVSLCLQMFNQRPRPPKIFEGMDRVIVAAAKRNTLAIVTGNTTPTVEAFLKLHGLREYIALVIGVEQKGSRPEKIRRALKELSQNVESVYMVGDAVSDIRAARETAIKSIAVSWGHQSPSRLRGANPDYQVNSPQELLALLENL
jgi:phosphoglycolate phosphatase-like HAD superfamily hydrolase